MNNAVKVLLSHIKSCAKFDFSRVLMAQRKLDCLELCPLMLFK